MKRAATGGREFKLPSGSVTKPCRESRVSTASVGGGGWERDQGSQLSRSSLFLSNQPPPKIQIARVFLELRQVPQNARSAAPIIHGFHYFVFHVNEKQMEIITIHI